MANTSVATGNALTKKLWAEKLYRDAAKLSYFMKFAKPSMESMVYLKTDLEKSKGDKVTFGVRMRLTGSGVTGATILDGNEEALTLHSASVTLDQYRHAVLDDGAITRKRVAFDLSEEQKDALTVWGKEKIDSLCFTALLNSPTKVFYRDSSGNVAANVPATAKAGLHATNSKINTTLISAIKTSAKTGGNRAYIPIRPIIDGNEEWYVLLVHPDCMYDLKQDSTFQQAQREALERGKDNPLFRGATAVWDGVIVHEHENCTIAVDGGGAAVAWASCAFMGAQALCFAWGERPELIEGTKDWGNQQGFAWSMICGATKPVFNSLDYGSLGVYLARTNISGL